MGGEGEGCIFNLYIIFFFLGFFRFLTLGSFFRFLPLPFTRIYKKRVFKPSPFTFLAILLMVRELRVKGGEGTFLFCIKHFFAFGHFKESLVGNGEI